MSSSSSSISATAEPNETVVYVMVGQSVPGLFKQMSIREFVNSLSDANWEEMKNLRGKPDFAPTKTKVVAAPKPKAINNRCEGRTSRGTHCKHSASEGATRCHQHINSAKFVEPPPAKAE